MSDMVFISYSSKDAQTIEKILQQMTANGIHYWKAPEMIPAGSNYAREIPRAIESCNVFVLMISESSQESIWVEKEIDCAINERKTIVPLNLTGIPLSGMFKFYLNNVQTIDYSKDPEGAMQQFLERLKGLVVADEVPAIEKPVTEKKVLKKTLEQKQESPKKEREARPAYSNSFSAAVKQMKLPEGRSGSSRQEQPIFAPVSERSNALNLNQIPVTCSNCGGEMGQIARGTYRCLDCGQEDYDSYQKVRNYLNKQGPRSVTQIMRATGVPRATIEFFLRDERLEIPESDAMRLICRGCGTSIRTGVLCDRCKRSSNVKQINTKLSDDKYRFIKRDR